MRFIRDIIKEKQNAEASNAFITPEVEHGFVSEKDNTHAIERGFVETQIEHQISVDKEEFPNLEMAISEVVVADESEPVEEEILGQMEPFVLTSAVIEDRQDKIEPESQPVGKFSSEAAIEAYLASEFDFSDEELFKGFVEPVDGNLVEPEGTAYDPAEKAEEVSTVPSGVESAVAAVEVEEQVDLSMLNEDLASTAIQEPEVGHAQSNLPNNPSQEIFVVPKPSTGRGLGGSGRVKTRLLGFGAPNNQSIDAIAKSATKEAATHTSFLVGWLVVTEGPGKGAAFTLYDGLTQIGRGEGQSVRLNFGDNSISRENHAAIAYDAEQHSFFLGQGGKANLVRLNGRPVLATEQLKTQSEIRIGETKLHFIALCGKEFSWVEKVQEDIQHAVHG